MGDTRPANWHESVHFGIHYDLHANENDIGLGAELTADNLRQMLLKVRPDWIQCDCKGHPGWTSWPTEVGSTAPGLATDMLAIHREVTRELGLRLGVHYSGVIDQRALHLHPEWAQVDVEGRPSPRSTCRLSDYRRELMIPQLIEIIDKYEVDGFWVDGENWGCQPCWCRRCCERFSAESGVEQAPRGTDDPGWREWLAFHRRLFVEHVTECAQAVHERKPECCYCSNWMYTIRQPEPMTAPVDYLSGDYMPNFGAYRAALESRFLDNRGVTWDLMCWGFIKQPTAGQRCIMKTALHLKQEVTEVLAHAGAVMVYVKPQRSGRLVGWQHDLLAEVADFCRQRREWSAGTESAAECAVLHDVESYYRANDPLFNYGAAVEPVEGALHALLETHHTCDIITEEELSAQPPGCKLIIVPERVALTAEARGQLTTFARAGGAVLVSGSHIARAWPEWVGAEADGDALQARSPWGAVFAEVDDAATGIAGPWQPVRCLDAEAVALALRDGDPTVNTTDTPLVTRRAIGSGSITAIHADCFRDYARNHDPRQRRLFEQLLLELDIAWEIELRSPRWLELVARRRDDILLLHLIHRGAGEMTYPARVIVDELPPLGRAEITVRAAAPPLSVALQPEGRAVPFEFDSEARTLRLTVALNDIHSIIAIHGHRTL